MNIYIYVKVSGGWVLTAVRYFTLFKYCTCFFLLALESVIYVGPGVAAAFKAQLE